MINTVAVALGGGSALTEGVTASYNNSGALLPGFTLSQDQGSTRPSAFINYILFDETYTPIEARSAPVGATAGVLHPVVLPTINVTQTGYLYVYLSYDNTAGNWVYFDEFAITYREGPAVQVNSYYPYGMAAMTWSRSGEYENNYLYQGKEYDSRTALHDFHARQYDGVLGRWFAIDPEDQFASPYLAMGNNPVMMVDPDGELAVAVGVLIVKKVVKGIKVAKAVKAAKTVSEAAKTTKAAKFAKITSNSLGGVTNAINNYDSDAGWGHLLGNFAAGYFGSAVGIGIEDGGAAGFFVGGVLTGMNDMAHGRIDNQYRLAQSFVGGGLSALAGKSFHQSVIKKWGLADKTAAAIKKNGMDRFASYGLQNVAANFAYDRDQAFFEKPLAIHGMTFMVGGIGAELQAGIMGKEFVRNYKFAEFGMKFLLSTGSYFSEYSANYFFKTKMQYVKFWGYGNYKGASYGIKSLAYSWLYTF